MKIYNKNYCSNAQAAASDYSNTILYGLKYNKNGLAIIRSAKEYKSILRNALQNFEARIDFEIHGYDELTYNLQVINDILREDPTINYGYRGSKIKLSWKGMGSNRTAEVYFEYMKTKVEMVEMKAKVEIKSEEIISSIIKPNMKDYEKELAIHDYIVNNARYDIENYNKNTIPAESYTDYGALIKGTAVCDGYAKAMFRLLNKAGVKCLYVTGTAGSEKHSWNMVYIGGNYYHVDATWDDPVTSNRTNIISYNYFNLTDDDIRKDHWWDRSKYPICNSKTYSYNNIR